MEELLYEKSEIDSIYWKFFIELKVFLLKIGQSYCKQAVLLKKSDKISFSGSFCEAFLTDIDNFEENGLQKK